MTVEIDDYSKVPADVKELIKFCLSLQQEFPEGFSKKSLYSRFSNVNSGELSTLVDDGLKLGLMGKTKIKSTIRYHIIPFKVPKELLLDILDSDIEIHKNVIAELEARKSEILNKLKKDESKEQK